MFQNLKSKPLDAPPNGTPAPLNGERKASSKIADGEESDESEGQVCITLNMHQIPCSFAVSLHCQFFLCMPLHFTAICERGQFKSIHLALSLYQTSTTKTTTMQTMRSTRTLAGR
jgi:hypothetical protein